MNDFTKDELESLFNWGEVYTEFGQSWVYEQYKPLLDKLKSMVDNYCEHVYLTFLENENQTSFIEKCMNCYAIRFYHE